MNISFLYPRTSRDVWNVCIAIEDEFKRRGYITKCYSNYTDDEKYTDKGLLDLLDNAKSGKFVPDVIFHFDYGMFQHPLLVKSSFPSAKWIVESGDDPQSLANNYMKIARGNFDVILTPDYPSLLVYLQHGFNAFWFPHFADSNLLPQWSESVIIPDLDAVCSRSVSDKFFQTVRLVLGDRFDTRSGLHAHDHLKYLLRGKIILQNSQYKEITRRLFEGMIVNRMVLADRPNPATHVHEIFTEGKHIVYFDNLDDCIDKVNYYTEYEKERLDIAQNGFNLVSKYHNVSARVDQLIKHCL